MCESFLYVCQVQVDCVYARAGPSRSTGSGTSAVYKGRQAIVAGRKKFRVVRLYIHVHRPMCRHSLILSGMTRPFSINSRRAYAAQSMTCRTDGDPRASHPMNQRMRTPTESSLIAHIPFLIYQTMSGSHLSNVLQCFGPRQSSHKLTA